MIIEGAFLKLPELMLGHSEPRTQFEATLLNQLAMGVLIELSARNIELPMHRIHTERSYSKFKGIGSLGRADLYVDLSDTFFNKGLWHHLYGMKPYNWIEAKYFGGIGRQAGSQSKTENAAYIALDIFRLCLFIEEIRHSTRENSRYLLILFKSHPKDYLAFGSKDNSERSWLINLFKQGDSWINIDLSKEPNSFRKIFGKSFVQNPHLQLKLRTYTRCFEPLEIESNFLYWGYLIRILDFEINFENLNLVYHDLKKEMWSENKNAN